jgi:hypothetical protein
MITDTAVLHGRFCRGGKVIHYGSYLLQRTACVARYIAVFSLVSFLIGGAYFISKDRSPQKRPSAPATAPGVEVDNAATVAAARHREARGPQQRAQTSSAQAAARPLPSGDRAPSLRSEPSSIHEDYLATLYHDDPAPTAESWSLHNAMKSSLDRVPRSLLMAESIECRLRMCRLELTFSSASADAEVMKSVFLEGGTDAYPRGFGAFAIPSREQRPDGTVRATLYVARYGDLSTSDALE